MHVYLCESVYVCVFLCLCMYICVSVSVWMSVFLCECMSHVCGGPQRPESALDHWELELWAAQVLGAELWSSRCSIKPSLLSLFLLFLTMNMEKKIISQDLFNSWKLLAYRKFYFWVVKKSSCWVTASYSVAPSYILTAVAAPPYNPPAWWHHLTSHLQRVNSSFSMFSSVFVTFSSPFVIFSFWLWAYPFMAEPSLQPLLYILNGSLHNRCKMICISLMISDVDHNFMCLLAMWVSSSFSYTFFRKMSNLACVSLCSPEQ